MRIAVGGIHTECSTYSPVLMAVEDFRVLRGADLLQAEYFDFLDAEGIEHLPLLHARAVPGGPVSRPTYDAFKAEFLDRLQQALPINGLYLAMHGAIKVDGMEDAEGTGSLPRDLSSGRTARSPPATICTAMSASVSSTRSTSSRAIGPRRTSTRVKR